MSSSISRSLVMALAALLVEGVRAESARADGPQLAHTVFFALKDHSPEARQKLIDACRKHHTGHEGTVSFAVGTIAEDVHEPASDRDFDVFLHLVFESKAAEGTYLTHPRHQQFIRENQDSWDRVRVFDAYLAPPQQ